MRAAAVQLLLLLLAGALAASPPFYPLQSAQGDPWAELKDRHAGERCLYMGNGPSLNRVDFEKHVKPAFSVVMGANKIYLGFDRFKFRPNYFAAANAKVLQQAASEILALPRDMVKFLRSDRWEHDEELNRVNNIVLFNSISTCQEGGAVCKILGESRPNECLRHCDNCFCDASKFVVEGNTITYISLQILFHMGCRDVVLIGVDHSFQQEGKPNSAQLLDGPDPNHFDPRYFGGQHWDLADLESSERHYHLARQHFKAHCGSITDATDRGKLTIFPKLPLSLVASPRTTLVAVLGHFDSVEAAWAQGVAMRSWKRLSPRPRIIVFARDAAGAALATGLGLEVYAADDHAELVGAAHASGRPHLSVADLIATDEPDSILFVAHPGTVLSREHRNAVQLLTTPDMGATVSDVRMITVDAALQTTSGLAAVAPAAAALGGDVPGQCRNEDDGLVAVLINEQTRRSRAAGRRPGGGGGESALAGAAGVRGANDAPGDLGVARGALVIFDATVPVDWNQYAPGDSTWLLDQLVGAGVNIGDSSVVTTVAIGPAPVVTYFHVLHAKQDTACNLAMAALAMAALVPLILAVRKHKGLGKSV